MCQKGQYIAYICQRKYVITEILRLECAILENGFAKSIGWFNMNESLLRFYAADE